MLQPGFKGYHPSTGRAIKNNTLWNRLLKLKDTGSLMGCSIQPDPLQKNNKGVEADVGQGLKQKHAYSIVDMAEMEGVDTNDKKTKFKLIRVRNPW